MTSDDHAPYQPDRELLNFRRSFGPEQRDILMLWRNRTEVFFSEQQVAIGRALGGNLRLLRPTFSVRDLWVKMARSQWSGYPHPV
jgi:hypothetical protein